MDQVVMETDSDAERKRDYLAGFLAQKPQVDAPGERVGAVARRPRHPARHTVPGKSRIAAAPQFQASDRR